MIPRCASLVVVAATAAAAATSSRLSIAFFDGSISYSIPGVLSKAAFQAPALDVAVAHVSARRRRKRPRQRSIAASSSSSSSSFSPFSNRGRRNRSAVEALLAKKEAKASASSSSSLSSSSSVKDKNKNGAFDAAQGKRERMGGKYFIGKKEKSGKVDRIKEKLCIGFSRVFQRYVVYRPRRGRGGPGSATSRTPDSLSSSEEQHVQSRSLGNDVERKKETGKEGEEKEEEEEEPPDLFCRFDDNCAEVIESFPFLDEAMDTYPSASLVRIDLVVPELDSDDPNGILAGMGTVPMSRLARIVLANEEGQDHTDGQDWEKVRECRDDCVEVAGDQCIGDDRNEENAGEVSDRGEHEHDDGDNNDDDQHENDDDDDDDDKILVLSPSQRSALERRGRSALRYLSGLAASFAFQSVRDPKYLRGIEDRIYATLEKRVGLKRFMPHDLGSIRRNYVRIADLLTRGRERKVAVVAATTIATATDPASSETNLGWSGGVSRLVGNSNNNDDAEKGTTTTTTMTTTVAVSSVIDADGGLAFTERAVRNLVSYFPEVCLYDYSQVEERVRFLTAPLPPKERMDGFSLLSDDDIDGNDSSAAASSTSSRRTIAYMKRRPRGRRPKNGKTRRNKVEFDGIDWPRLSWEGYGAGLTIQQATAAVRSVPNLLALHHTDAQKPSVLYFYRDLNVDPALCRDAERVLGRYLVGSDPSDAAFLAYLRGLGVGWDSIRVLMDAFPALTVSESEPGWELINEGPVRRTLSEEAMIHLRKRLQVGPGEIFHMMKTHSRMSLYGVKKNMSKLDAIQSLLGLTSRQLRIVMLRMPSLLGMGVGVDEERGSPSALQRRLDFFLCEAGMSEEQLRAAIIKQPSLVHYAVDSNLRPKMKFLTDELAIPTSAVSRIISTAPAFMGLSLSENLRPTAETIMKLCDLSANQVGEIVVVCPQVLTLSVKRKIEPCLSFLAEALKLSSERDLGTLVMKAPRVLIQGIESSLVQKMHMLQEAVAEENKQIGVKADSGSLAALLMVRNPSLLVTTNQVFARRLRACLDEPDATLSVALEPKAKGRTRQFAFSSSLLGMESKTDASSEAKSSRNAKSVLELSPDSDKVLNLFSSVNEVAKHLNVTNARVYSACRQQGKLLKGRRFVYAGINSSTSNPARGKIASWKQGSKMTVIEPLRLFDGSSNDEPPIGKVSIVCFASGQVFPPDSKTEVRGTYQTGGMAVYFPQALSGRRTLAAQLRVAAESSWGLIIPEDEGGYSFNSGCIMADFTPLNPSRNRCELCSCELALKVVRNLLKQAAATTDLSKSDVHISVYTSSSYAWKLLRDSEQLQRWSTAPTVRDFVYDGEGPAALANPDLLYPISQIVRELRGKVLTGRNSQKLVVGNTLSVSFHHSADAFPGRTYEGFAKRIDDYARRAAVWAFERERNAIPY